MEFVIGDEVVYPHHGASVIEGVETLSITRRPDATTSCCASTTPT